MSNIMFNLDKIKEIHRAATEGLDNDGVDFHPGEFRTPVPSDQIYNKGRKAEGIEYRTYYSDMDEVAIENLNKTLKRCDPEKLSALNSNKFAQEMGDIYAHLDHIHPFYDGNSRTLRAFTKELAIASGHTINWKIPNENQSSKEGLYIARDNSSHNVGVELATSTPKKRLIYEAVDTLEDKQNMNDIMQKIVDREPEKVLDINKVQNAIEKTAQSTIDSEKQKSLALNEAEKYYNEKNYKEHSEQYEKLTTPDKNQADKAMLKKYQSLSENQKNKISKKAKEIGSNLEKKYTKEKDQGRKR